MGFYIHFVIFILVIAGLAAVNWLFTPEVWWAQWPFLGWGIGVLAHALCALGGPSNPVTRWQLRKLRELSDPRRPPRPATARRSPLSALAMLIVGALLGCAAAGSYMYVRLEDAQQKLDGAEKARDKFNDTVRRQEQELKAALDTKSSLEAAAREAKQELEQMRASKEAVDRALNDTKQQQLQAESERDAAQRALSEAKRGTQP